MALQRAHLPLGEGLAATQAQGPFSRARPTLLHTALSTFPTAGPGGWADVTAAEGSADMPLPYAHSFLVFSENKVILKISEKQRVGRSAGRGAQGGFLETWKRVRWGLLMVPLGACAPSEESEAGGAG